MRTRFLADGQLEAGFTEYEWRATGNRDGSAPRWRGQRLTGETVILYAEQGSGDTIQFARYAPMVAVRGARVILAVPRILARLMRTIEGVSDIIADANDPVPVPLFCLPVNVVAGRV